jgi:hypothetical protein
MKKIYRSANGKSVDMDAMRVANEKEIAIGNMKVNAAGDELGPGGIVLRTRNEIMQDYYQTNTVYTTENVADAEREGKRKSMVADAPAQSVTDLGMSDLPADILEQDAHMPEPTEPKLRGSLADAVAKTAKVEQKLLTPRKGITRM